MADHNLKPCPFCGGEAELRTGRAAEDASFAYVRCKGCLVSTDHYEDAYAPVHDAIWCWNRRSPPAASDALSKLIYESVRFSIWAGGQGISPADGEPAANPEEFIYAYVSGTGDEDMDTLPDRASSSRTSPPAAVPEGLMDALKSAEKALRPFYSAVFNDNGDMTVHGGYRYHEAVAGYSAYKRVRDALSAAPATPNGWQPIVNPLEWKDLSCEDLVLHKASWGEYSIIKDDCYEWPYMLRPFIAGPSNFRSLEDAKAAAQADYERRILSALSLPAAPTEATNE